MGETAAPQAGRAATGGRGRARPALVAPGALVKAAVKAVIQRVSRASVSAGGRRLGEIGRGLVVLVGVAQGDGERDTAFIADRIIGMRLFDDGQGRMNLALQAAGGALLVVSQFTLLADTTTGRRPSFAGAAPAQTARALYQRLIERFRESGAPVEHGEFGARMEVALTNEGPVTIVLDSRKG